MVLATDANCVEVYQQNDWQDAYSQAAVRHRFTVSALADVDLPLLALSFEPTCDKGVTVCGSEFCLIDCHP